MPFSIGDPLIPSLYLQPFSRYLHPNISGSRPWPFRVTWRHRSQMPLPTSDVQNNIFTGFLITQHVSAAIFKSMGTIYWVTNLTLQGHMTSSIAWPFWPCYFLLCPAGTEPLSSTVFEMFASKYIGAMIDLYLSGYVTSPVTWPFDTAGSHFL